MVELVQSAWGDWWVLADGEVLAVHLRSHSDAQTEGNSRRHATEARPGETIIVRRFGETGPSVIGLRVAGDNSGFTRG